jgi:phospholipid/cholesterol/gamma-HCH transport system substrate-binding protein
MNGEMKVGLFVMAGGVLLGMALFLLGDYSFRSYYPVYAEFSDVVGLPDKSVIKLSGVEIGKIKKIFLKEDHVVVQLAILEDVKIYRGARFSVGSTSMIGSKFLQIDQGNPALGRIMAGDTVQGENTVPLEKAVAKALDSIEGLAKDLRGNGRTAVSLQEILDNLRGITANLNEMVANGQPHADKIMERLDSITAKMDAIVGKIDNGDGVAGALVSDQKMKDNVSAAITNLKDASATVKDVLGRINGFHTYWRYDYNYEPVSGASKSNFGLRIYPRDGRYYYIGADNVINTKDRIGGRDYEVNNTVDAQLGWELGGFDLYAGIIRGFGGAGVRWKPFYNSAWDKFTLLAEGSNISRDRVIKGRLFNNPRVDAGISYSVNKYISTGVRLNDLLETKVVDYTASLAFEDKDISYLFGLVTFGSAGTKGRSSSN